jgi:ABC-type phosphate transport system substrate-binding protein
MRRALIPLALGVALLAGMTPARPDMVGPGTDYCDGQAARSRGEGTPAQTAVHTKIFSRAFAKACAKEAGLVSYLGTGTRRGFLGMMARRIPFAGSDVPLSTADWALVQKGDYTWNSPVHQIPLYVDGWAVAYNLPCAGPQLKLRSQTLALMYQNVITSWNDPILGVDNPWLSTCNQRIRLARRADDAAATDAFQDYLAKRNPVWTPYRRGVTPQRWPTSAFACSGLGDAGMVNCVRSFRGSVGYVSIATAKALRLKVALVENAGGALVPPTPAACTAAAATATPPPGTSPVTLPNGTRTAWMPATQGDWSRLHRRPGGRVSDLLVYLRDHLAELAPGIRRVHVHGDHPRDGGLLHRGVVAAHPGIACGGGVRVAAGIDAKSGHGRDSGRIFLPVHDHGGDMMLPRALPPVNRRDAAGQPR